MIALIFFEIPSMSIIAAHIQRPASGNCGKAHPRRRTLDAPCRRRNRMGGPGTDGPAELIMCFKALIAIAKSIENFGSTINRSSSSRLDLLMVKPHFSVLFAMAIKAAIIDIDGISKKMRAITDENPEL